MQVAYIKLLSKQRVKEFLSRKFYTTIVSGLGNVKWHQMSYSIDLIVLSKTMARLMLDILQLTGDFSVEQKQSKSYLSNGT